MAEHADRAHALLSASGAHRWLNCTPSPRLEEKFMASSKYQEKQSVYAKEGTLAHELADIQLRLHNKEISKNVYAKELKKIQSNELYTAEMPDHVGAYVDYVKEVTAQGILKVEQKVDYSHIAPGGFGTGDAAGVQETRLDVIDLKYGKGIKVEAKDNPQLKLYALGLLNELDLMYDFRYVMVHIVQPRLDHISTAKYTVEELKHWGEKIARPRALKAHKGEGEKIAGDWCKWCKIKPLCRELANKNLEIAKHDFKEPDLLSDEELLAVFKMQSLLVDWSNSVSEYVTYAARTGKNWPGYKLVEGRSNRRWVEEQAVIDYLKSKRIKQTDFLNKKLKGIKAIQTLLGKDKFAPLNEYIIKPPGAPTLVPESDPRPAFGVEQAKEDFK